MAVIFFLISLGIVLLPVVGATFLFRLPRLKTRQLKPIRILILMLLALLPLYWTALCFQILPFPPSGNEIAAEAYRFYDRSSSGDSLPDQLVGGGYQWFPEGSDLWIRFQDNANYGVEDADPLCNSETVLKMSQWFARRVPTAQDRENLRDYDSLSCSGSEDYNPIQNDWLFGLPSTPKSCSESWRLHHRPSRFVYFRFRCHVI
ncbi:MAG: hypothetical protein F6K30_23100 [Cyanothece sp. SIO2G6]|nr:hypothetical protein [Cyanothece sp. SIO2G6]